MKKFPLLAAAAVATALPSAAFAAMLATAVTDLNVRSGPGPEHPVIGFVQSREEVSILGCIEGSRWCQITHKGKPGDQWIYLPELQRVRPITSNTRTQSFVGTDLTYHDLDILTEMISWTEADAASSLRPDETVDGVACSVIELAAKRDDIKYKKIVLWLGKDDLVPRRLEFYDDDPMPTKRITQSDVRKVGAIPVAYKTKVETPAKHSSTDVTVVETKFNQKLADDLFTQKALEQGPQ